MLPACQKGRVNMPVDQQTSALLEAMSSLSVWPPVDIVEARRLANLQFTPLEAERAHVLTVREGTIPAAHGAVPVRIYTPKPQDAIAPLTPILVYFHGGGFVLGSLDLVDGLCCQIARSGGVIVVSVDYRLAPEHKFPAAAEDAYAATQWVAAHAGAIGGDAARIAVGGDSAGANLAAVACLMAKDRETQMPAFQVLMYPSTNGRLETASALRNGEGYLLTREMMNWFTAQYQNSPADTANPYYSPLRHPSHVGLPPALVITAEYDPLLDEGKAYADRLEAACVAVDYHCFGGTIHGFVTFYQMLDKGRDAIELIGKRLRSAFA